MSIIITGATGQLGGLIINNLLENEKIPAQDIVAVARNTDKAKQQYADLGIEIRYGDYDNPESLPEAFAGASKLLFISSSSFDDTERIVQHANVVKAGRDAGVKHIAYTSYAFAEESQIPLALLHLNTEYAIRVSGTPYTFIRNSLYSEVFINKDLAASIENGAIVTNAGAGRINTVNRADLAKGTAAILASEGHENKTYNFVSSTTWSFDELAEVVTKVTGKNVKHTVVSYEEQVKLLTSIGLPEGVAAFSASTYQAISEGETAKTSNDLKNLIGEESSLTDMVKNHKNLSL
ncbi:SDR family oxidoreductase [Radiobacillus sp. PE A8.2]|uniref:SDR family oxidoreductase n=1 Tax=Radiobacillus sp. PE A8.2 TaxID=3380349 RepID=UPI00388EF3FF